MKAVKKNRYYMFVSSPDLVDSLSSGRITVGRGVIHDLKMTYLKD